jgi:hypothetical protein
VCTFWLPPNSPLQSYQVVTHTTKQWGNATIGFYAATVSSNGFYRLDNVIVSFQPGGSSTQTTCVDPLAPAPPGGAAGPNLITNGDFATNALPPWSTFGQVTTLVASQVLNFGKLAGTPAGVVLQATGQPVNTGEIMTATFQLGNTSNVRKRATVIIHDNAFGDLSACTFWMAPNQPLSNYSYRTYATAPWTNLTMSVYPATVGTDQAIQLDNVVLQRTPGSAGNGVACIEPSPAADAAATVARRAPVASRLSGAAGSAADARANAADTAEQAGDDVPGESGSHTVSDGAWEGDGFLLEDTSLPPRWTATAAGVSRHTLTRIEPVAVSAAGRAGLALRSWLSVRHGSSARVEISVDGTAWSTLTTVGASDGWVSLDVDLSAHQGTSVFVRLVFDATTPPGGEAADGWRVEVARE